MTFPTCTSDGGRHRETRLQPARRTVSFRPSFTDSAHIAVTPVVSNTISRTELDLPLLRRGKVRDVYDLGDALLFVATDRISAFDVVLPQPVPRKGEVLTLISAWWFQRTRDISANHMLSVDPETLIAAYPPLASSRGRWERRAMLVRKLEPFPVECVVRGYIAGSAWKEYGETGTLAGEPMPRGLISGGRLEPAIFSPATKAEEGHDENITFIRMCDLIGARDARALREISLQVYERGREIADAAGIVIADTKLEFGRASNGSIMIMDELLTPDSSRFWPVRGQRSLDKQPVRDHLEDLVGQGAWDKQPPAPDLPPSLVEDTSRRYQDVFARLTGVHLDAVDLAAWPPAS
jgi:phosphoribosylaminoimidazole-succinocarboxamide synthase